MASPGGADDQGPGHSPQGNGQDLGILLRLGPSRPGAVARGNPFAGVAGARPEIWAHGFRNAYRFTFSGDTLIAADAGQNDIEELNFVSRAATTAGRSRRAPSSSHRTTPTGSTPTATATPTARRRLTAPASQRACGAPSTSTTTGRRSPTARWPGVRARRHGDVGEPAFRDRPTLGLALLGFGRDPKGELYVLASQTGNVSGTSGVVLRLDRDSG